METVTSILIPDYEIGPMSIATKGKKQDHGFPQCNKMVINCDGEGPRQPPQQISKYTMLPRG